MNVRKLLELGGRAALVTGGSRGLGLQLAEALGEMGARVAITARKKDELDHAVSHLENQKIEAAAFVCDVGKREAIPGLVDAVLAKFGKIDILVNNAGVPMGPTPIEDVDDALVDLQIEREPLPYPAGFVAAKAFVRYRRSGGTKRSPLADFYIGAHAAVEGIRTMEAASSQVAAGAANGNRRRISRTRATRGVSPPRRTARPTPITSSSSTPTRRASPATSRPRKG